MVGWSGWEYNGWPHWGMSGHWFWLIRYAVRVAVGNAATIATSWLLLLGCWLGYKPGGVVFTGFA